MTVVNDEHVPLPSFLAANFQGAICLVVQAFLVALHVSSFHIFHGADVQRLLTQRDFAQQDGAQLLTLAATGRAGIIQQR